MYMCVFVYVYILCYIEKRHREATSRNNMCVYTCVHVCILTFTYNAERLFLRKSFFFHGIKYEQLDVVTPQGTSLLYKETIKKCKQKTRIHSLDAFCVSCSTQRTICTCVFICTYICTYMYMYVHVYVCMYIYIRLRNTLEHYSS